MSTKFGHSDKLITLSQALAYKRDNNNTSSFMRGSPASRAVQAECRAKLAWTMPRRSLPSPERAIYGFSCITAREAAVFFVL